MFLGITGGVVAFGITGLAILLGNVGSAAFDIWTTAGGGKDSSAVDGSVKVCGVSGRAEGVCGSVKSEGADGSSRVSSALAGAPVVEGGWIGGSDDDRDGCRDSSSIDC
jgi:hypothetical protein